MMVTWAPEPAKSCPTAAARQVTFARHEHFNTRDHTAAVSSKYNSNAAEHETKSSGKKKEATVILPTMNMRTA